MRAAVLVCQSGLAEFELIGHRACLNPPPKSTGTNRMEDYLPNEFALIGCRHRRDSMQPEKNIFLKREEHVFDPFFFLRRTERPDRTGTSKALYDGD